MTRPTDVPLRADLDRLMGRLAQLADVGRDPHGGTTRLALSDADRAGRDLVVGWMHDAGLDVTVDEVGNVVGIRPGRIDGPVVMTGSHIDTVRRAGAYDGNLGVLAGIELVERLDEERITTERPIAVAFFTNEEGARFQPDMLGSLAYVGGIDVREALDAPSIDGQRLGDELARIGYAGPHPCPGSAPAAFVELHIEQGPVLERAAVPIGVVTGVQAISWQQVTYTGRARHAGTTPMELRNDAGRAAIDAAHRVHEIAHEVGAPLVATIGSLRLEPDLVNVVPGRASFTVDVRHIDDAVLDAVDGRIADAAQLVAREHGVDLDRRRLARFAAVPFDPRIRSLIEDAARRLGLATTQLVSGAGHDAQMLARVCPTGMVFVPSTGGISHHPDEHTDTDAIAAGFAVLADVVRRLAGDEERA
jgi:N-carbamoyl-L-amino-acid hydrolase